MDSIPFPPHVLTALHINEKNYRLILTRSFIWGIHIFTRRRRIGSLPRARAPPSLWMAAVRGRPNSPGSILESRFCLASAPPLRLLHGADRGGRGRSCSPLIMEFNVNSITRPTLPLLPRSSLSAGTVGTEGREGSEARK